MYHVVPFHLISRSSHFLAHILADYSLPANYKLPGMVSYANYYGEVDITGGRQGGRNGTEHTGQIHGKCEEEMNVDVSGKDMT